jgi:CheY-like chemotaxis protein/nitrogen-specific signal transduction histidine kinase
MKEQKCQIEGKPTREAAEAAKRAKSASLATLIREIRMPINGVVSTVERLLDSPLSEAQAEAVQTIRASASSVLHVIDDILDFSKIEPGSLELARAPVALPELIGSVCKSLSSVAAAKEVDLSSFTDPQVPGRVWSDASRLRQVLYNLTGNAIKFSAGFPGRRGQVSLRVGLTQTAPQRLVLRIADNGIGMAPQALERLVSSFTPAKVSAPRDFGGTGLSLAICKRLVDLMNGEITVRSTLDKGSTFTVTLPIDEVEGSAQRPAADLAGLDCILIGSSHQADDVRTYLEHSGMRVHQVATVGAAAQQAAGLERPVVVIHTSRQGLSPDTLHAAFADTPDVRSLLILPGHSGGPPIDAQDAVTLDCNCLLRSSLLRAVAVAAGRASPETFQDSGSCDLAAEPVAPTVAEARAQGRLILVAEHDEIKQQIILRQLEVLGYAAEVVGNGVEALQLWRAGHYGLLLSDLHMPEMDGYALAGAIRAEEAKQGVAQQERMPILALNANALRGEAIRAREAGMDDHLPKPLPLSLLQAALTKWPPRGRRGQSRAIGQ